MMKPFILKSANFVAIAISCASLGIGIGFIQGEIVARMGTQDERFAFAGTGGMVGGLVALFLGPILFYALRRRISFDQFCCIAALSLVTGCAAAWLSGLASMFVTPITAILLAVNFTRK
jgi:Na+/glutamate symporter